MLKQFLVLDESGFLHTNASGRYFVIGGYISQSPSNINKKYKKIISILKNNKKTDIKEELKASHIDHKDKREILKRINLAEDTQYVFIVIDKNHVTKQNKLHINLFYNYAVMLLIKCLCNYGIIKNELEQLHILLDSRSIKIGSLDGLADYINTKVYIENEINREFTTYCEYIESHTHSGIQVADLLCNILWCKFNYPDTDGSSQKMLEKEHYICKFPLGKFGN